MSTLRVCKAKTLHLIYVHKVDLSNIKHHDYFYYKIIKVQSLKIKDICLHRFILGIF